MSSPRYRRADYLEALQQFMPRGRVWPRDPDTTQTKMLQGLTGCYEANDARSLQLIKDAFPPTTMELLPEWEATLGLPDPCAGDKPTSSQRRDQVVARFVGMGGQTPAYFIGVAAALGYVVTITQFAPARFGRSFGRAFGGQDWAHTWQVNVPQFTVKGFPFDAGNFGDPFMAWDNTVLQCALQAIAPAHTLLLFSYS